MRCFRFTPNTIKYLVQYPFKDPLKLYLDRLKNDLTKCGELRTTSVRNMLHTLEARLETRKDNTDKDNTDIVKEITRCLKQLAYHKTNKMSKRHMEGYDSQIAGYNNLNLLITQLDKIIGLTSTYFGDVEKLNTTFTNNVPKPVKPPPRPAAAAATAAATPPQHSVSWWRRQAPAPAPAPPRPAPPPQPATAAAPTVTSTASIKPAQTVTSTASIKPAPTVTSTASIKPAETVKKKIADLTTNLGKILGEIEKKKKRWSAVYQSYGEGIALKIYIKNDDEYENYHASKKAYEDAKKELQTIVDELKKLPASTTFSDDQKKRIERGKETLAAHADYQPSYTPMGEKKRLVLCEKRMAKLKKDTTKKQSKATSALSTYESARAKCTRLESEYNSRISELEKKYENTSPEEPKFWTRMRIFWNTITYNFKYGLKYGLKHQHYEGLHGDPDHQSLGAPIRYYHQAVNEITSSVNANDFAYAIKVWRSFFPNKKGIEYLNAKSQYEAARSKYEAARSKYEAARSKYEAAEKALDAFKAELKTTLETIKLEAESPARPPVAPPAASAPPAPQSQPAAAPPPVAPTAAPALENIWEGLLSPLTAALGGIFLRDRGN